MDKFDHDTKALERAENVIRTVLTAKTDIETILPLLGYSNAEDALNDAKKVVAGLPAPALAAFDRKVKRAASNDGE